MNKAVLLEDIVTKSKPKILYAKKGEVVTIAHVHGNVLIVERVDGFKFSVNESKVQKI